MIKCCFAVLFCVFVASCAHRHHDHIPQLASSVAQLGSAVLNDSETSTDTATNDATTPVSTDVDVIATNTAVITVYENDFDTALFDTISTSTIANGDNLPSSQIASYAGHVLLADSIEGSVALRVDFSSRTASGEITNMTYYGDAGFAALTGQLDMLGQTVSRVGLKLDVDGNVSSELTGSGAITGTLRGVFHGSGPDAFAGYLTGTTTLPITAGQTMSGPMYAQSD